MTNAKKILAISLSLCSLLLLSILFAITDLNIWQTLEKSVSSFWFSFGTTMEILGELVAPFLFAISGIIIVLYYNVQTQEIKHKQLKIYSGFGCMVIGIGYSIYVFLKLDILSCILCIILTGIMFYFIYKSLIKMNSNRLFEFYQIALTAIFYCIAVLIVINLFKIPWGCVRPRDMKDISQFSVWYLPQGINGNRSFPSGHTANATVLFVITMFTPLVKKRLSKVLLYVIPIIWIIIMATCRIIIGAHFASDVLYGGTISIILFYIVKHYSLKYIKNPNR